MPNTVPAAGEAMSAHQQVRRLSWQIADLLNDLDPRMEFITVRPSKLGPHAVFSGFEFPMPGEVTIEGLFTEWLAVRDLINSERPDTDDALFDVYRALQAQITAMHPNSARDLSMMLVVETDCGGSDYRDDFMSRVFDLCGMTLEGRETVQ